MAEASSAKPGVRRATGGSGMYQATFLKDKLEEQKAKKKQARKSKFTKEVPEKDEEKIGGPNFDPMAQAMVGAPKEAPEKKTATSKRKPQGEQSEHLEELIEELQNDLRLRDDEWEEQRDRIAKLETQNLWLRTKVMRERETKMTVEAKLNKIINMKEIE